jgi:hypothetical protein
MEELKDFENKLKSIGILENDLGRSMTMFPNWVFVSPNYYFETGKLVLSYLTNNPARTEQCYQDYIVNDENVSKTIYKLSDWNRVKNILLKGSDIIEPSYKPRKIDRTIESLNESTYYSENDQLPLDNMPKYKIGEMVKLKENAYDLMESDSRWTIHPNQREFLKNYKGEPIKITEKFFTDSDTSDIDKKNIWWSRMSYRFDGVWILDELIQPPITTPNYSPRRFHRTVEGLDSRFIPMSIYCGTNESTLNCEKYLHDLGWSYNDGSTYILKNHYSDIDSVTFFEFETKTKTMNVARGYRRDEVGKEPIYPVDKSIINKLLGVTPSYKPRKIDRTIENVSEPKYRFKTKGEFIRDFGNNWRTEIGWGKFGDMDYLLGQPIDDGQRYFIKRDGGFFMPRKTEPSANWYIDADWLTDEPLRPDYSPKKFDRSINEEYHGYLPEEIRKTYYFQNYDVFLVVFKNTDDKQKVHHVVTLLQDIFNVQIVSADTMFSRGFDEWFIYIRHCFNSMDIESGWDETEYLERFHSGDKYPKLYKPNEVDTLEKVNSILKFGKSSPTYIPRKFDRTLESMDNFNFTVVCDNRKDCLEFEDFLHKLGYKYGSGSKYLLSIYPDIYSVTFKDFNEKDKIFDVVRGIQNYYNLIDYKTNKRKIQDSFRKTPNYSPRKFDRTLEKLNESFEFITTEQKLRNWPTKPKFTFGQKVLLKKDAVNIHLSKIDGRYHEEDNQIKWIESQIGQVLIVDSFVNDPDWNNLWIVYCKDRTGKSSYVQQDALVSYQPSYIPKNFDRTLESIDNKYNFDVLNSYYFNKYNSFIVVFDKNMNIDYYRRIIGVINEFFHAFDSSSSWLTDVSTNVGNHEDLYYMAFTKTRGVINKISFDGWCFLSYLDSNPDHNRGYSRPFYYNELDTPHKMISILRYGSIIPSYTPRKIERTTESIDNKPYGQVVFEINNKEQFVYVLKYLFQNTNITWVDNNRDLSEITRYYPIYLFVNFPKDNVSWGNEEDLGNIEEYINDQNNSNQGDSNIPQINPHIFKYKDVDKLEYIKIGIDINVPNYQPKKIIRTLESHSLLKEGYIVENLGDEGNEFSIIIDNEQNNKMIQKYLFTQGYRWHGSLDEVRPLDPGNVLTCYKSSKELIWAQNINDFNEFFRSGWRYNPKIYTMKDWITYSNLVRLQSFHPSYKPRKIDRTLESILPHQNVKYQFIIFKFENQEDFTNGQKILIKQGFTWRSDEYNTEFVNSNYDFPCYLFVQGYRGDNWDNHIYYDCEENLNNGNPFDTIRVRSNGVFSRDICPEIFTLKDCDKVNSLFNWRVTPSYKPRKIDRNI